MLASLRRWLGVVSAVGLAAALAGAAEQPRMPYATDPKPSAPGRDEPGRKEEGPRAPGLDAAGLPGGVVLVICEEVKDALRLLPKAVMLTPQKYQELLDQIEQLKQQLKPDRPVTPSACRLTGRVEGEVVRLRAQFEFRTYRPGALVALGCQGAWLAAATLDDDQLPVLHAGEDGWVVQVDTAGAHRLTLDLVDSVSKGNRGGDWGFDLTLPRAAITSLEHFDLPPSVAEVRVAGRTVPAPALHSKSAQREALYLGPADRLELAWKGPAARPQSGPSLLAAEGRILFQVEPTYVVTEADLTLKVLQGETAQWRLQMPPQTRPEVLEPKPHDERIASLDFDKAKGVLTIGLKKPSAEPVRVVLRVRQPRPGTRLAVGPFTVLDPSRQGVVSYQRGTIVVLVSPAADLRLHFLPHADVTPREVPAEHRQDPAAVAAFTYWSLLAPAEPAQPVPAPLQVEVETGGGAVAARVAHVLTLTERGWRATTKIDVTPRRTAVERLEVQLPAGYEYDQSVGASPLELVQAVDVSRATRRARIALVQKQSGTFSVTLPGLYALDGEARKASLELPRVLGTLDHGGEVTVVVPEGLELLAQPAGAEGPAPGARRHTWSTDRAPRRVELAWRPHRLPVDAVADVTLTDRQVLVHHRLRVQFAQESPGRLLLRVPALFHNRLRVESGGQLVPAGTADPAARSTNGEGPADDRDVVWAFLLTEPEGKEHQLVLEYGFPLADDDVAPGRTAAAHPGSPARRLALPLVRPEQATQGETRVRVWSEPGVQVALADGPWEEQRTEVVPERDSLPALVLRGASLDLPLALRLTGAPLATVVVERILVQARVLDSGYQAYRARFLLTKLSTRHLELELPAPLSSLNFDVSLDRKKVPWVAVDDGGKESAVGTRARLTLSPDFTRKPLVLEVNYQLAPGRKVGNGLLQTTFHPPLLRGEGLLGRVRWHVGLPSAWLPLYHQDGLASEQQWGWRGWLLAPQPSWTGEALEGWFRGTDVPAPEGEGEPQELPSLVCRRNTLDPLWVLHVPQQAWLLVCSVTLMILGLILYFTPLSRLWFWSVVAAAGLLVALAGTAWPGVLAAVVYGCEPGGLVLVVVLAVQWMLHQRYRRQVVFMPGFTRLKTGSSLIRAANRPPAEPSTVDEPPKPRKSSVSSEPGGGGP